MIIRGEEGKRIVTHVATRSGYQPRAGDVVRVGSGEKLWRVSSIFWSDRPGSAPFDWTYTRQDLNTFLRRLNNQDQTITPGQPA